MSERVSIKGLGQEIFFSDNEGPGHAAGQLAEQATEGLAPAEQGATAPGPPGAEVPANEPTVAPAKAPGAAPTLAPTVVPPSDEREFFGALTLPETLKRKLRAMSRERHLYHTSIRITEEERDQLKTITYELGAKLPFPVTGNEIGRIALRLLMEDYDIRKKESLLVQVLKEDDRF
jgi:hypothetical protein